MMHKISNFKAQKCKTKTNTNPNRYRRRCPDPNADEKGLIIDELDVSKNSRLVQYERHSKGFEPNIFRQEIDK